MTTDAGHGAARDDAPTDIWPGAEAAVLALNNAHAVELSWLDSGRLTALLARAFYARAIGHAEAFLLAFDQGAGGSLSIQTFG